MDELEQLSQISPSERILLLPHCLRHSNTCKAKYNQEGLQCIRCNPECSINRLSAAALECGYKGICVAPGGKLAIKFVKKQQPQAIVAIACDKELEEGVQGVKELSDNMVVPVTVIIPLLKDGCIDTEVDELAALEVIEKGCSPRAVEENRPVLSGKSQRQ